MAFPFLCSMLQALKKIDVALLELINRDWSAPWLDKIVPWLRYQELWYPFYIFMAAFAVINFGRRGWWWILSFIATIGLSDTVSSKLIKPTVERLRPCYDPEVFPLIELRVPRCSGGFSFTSSHAANHFAMAAFIFVTVYPFFGKKARWIFVWPILVSYAQVYVGVHYPFDVLAGAVVGMILGTVTGRFFNQRMSMQQA